MIKTQLWPGADQRPEVLIALLLLGGDEGGDVAGVAPRVVAVVTGDHLVILSLLHDHHLG